MTILQQAFGVVAEVKPGAEAALTALFKQIQPQIESNPVVPFGQLNTVHFARCVLVEQTKDYPSYLIFATYYDEPLSDHLAELVRVAGPGLLQIFGYCRDFPVGAGVNALVPFMQAHARDYVAFYSGTRARSVPQIRQEAALRDAIEALLDAPANRNRWHTMTPAEVRAEIQAFVRGRQDLAWAQSPDIPLDRYPDAKRDGTPVGWVANIFATLLQASRKHTGPAINRAKIALVVFLAMVAPPLILFLLLIRLKELRDRGLTRAVQAQVELAPLVENEDQVAQSPLTHLAELKTGRVRSFSLGLVLNAIDVLARRIFIYGELGGIPSIHFARWIMLDNGRRVIFFSDFDGSWENYLSEFIDRAARGLTGIWSNTEGFPETRFLIFQGARDEQSFKAWTRNHQVATGLWYSGYPYLSVQNINNNSAIRQGLWNPMSPQEIETWLGRF